MSRATYDPIRAGENRAASRINAIYAALETAAGAVNAENFAEEGLDQRVIAFNAHADELFYVEDQGRATLAPTGASHVQYVQSGPVFRSGNLGALAADEVLRLTSFVWLESRVSTGVGLTAGGVLRMQHEYNDGVSAIKVPASEGAVQVRAGQVVLLHGMVPIVSWLIGPITTISWVQLAYANITGTANAGRAVFFVDKFYNVTVTT